MALDSAGNPYLTYVKEGDDYQLKRIIAHWTGSEWTYEEVGGFTSSQLQYNKCLISVDQSDRPHIYTNTGPDMSVMHYWKESGWMSEVIYTPPPSHWLTNWTLAEDLPTNLG